MFLLHHISTLSWTRYLAKLLIIVTVVLLLVTSRSHVFADVAVLFMESLGVLVMALEMLHEEAKSFETKGLLGQNQCSEISRFVG